MVKRNIVRIDESKCDGCGQCISNCAEGALKILDCKAKLINEVYCDGLGVCLGACPRNAITVEEQESKSFDEEAVKAHLSIEKRKTRLRNWPVQLNLVNPKASFFQNASLLIMADCVPVAHPDYQGNLLKGQVVLIGCPKFDDFNKYLDKLTKIFTYNQVRNVTIIHMEVPCCSGLGGLVDKALRDSGKDIPVQRIVLNVEGEQLDS